MQGMTFFILIITFKFSAGYYLAVILPFVYAANLSLQNHCAGIKCHKYVGKCHYKAQRAEQISVYGNGLALKRDKQHWQNRHQIFALETVKGVHSYKGPGNAHKHYYCKKNKEYAAKCYAVFLFKSIAVIGRCKYRNYNYTPGRRKGRARRNG